MKMEVLGYEVFENTGKFEKWQKEYPNKAIIGMQPQILSFDMDLGEKNPKRVEGEAKTKIGIFVTYKYESNV